MSPITVRSSSPSLVVGFALLAFGRAPVGVCAETSSDDDVLLDALTVTATRIPLLIRDEPLHIEAVPLEEIEENLTVQPGNLSSLLNELPSVRLQSTAPGLGGSGLQLRGMPARDTLVLSDGLPLVGAQADSFGLLQTLPLHLSRVEVIKGAASALYGGAALGGVLNLVSKTPDAAAEFLANLTSHGGRDVEAFIPERFSPQWSGTLTVGANDQSGRDLDGEGWVDLPEYRRYSVRPRAWWSRSDGGSLFLTAGITAESRQGGTSPGRVLPDGVPFPETLGTHRFDAGAVNHMRLGEDLASTAEVSATTTRLHRTFGEERVASTQSTVLVDDTVSGQWHGQHWVTGIAFQHDSLDSAVPGVGYRYDTPGMFVQDEAAPASWLRLAGSVRLDVNPDYGSFVSPRWSALFHSPDSDWSLRASLAGGYAPPSPFVDQVDATGLGPVLPLGRLHAERGTTASLDAKWADDGWEVNASVFESDIHDPLEAVNAVGDKFKLQNAPGARRAPGAEILFRWVTGRVQLIGSWSTVNPTAVLVPGFRQAVPLIPRQSGEIGAIWEREQRGRFGVEFGYTGRQALDEDPYRRTSEPYVECNILGEIRIARRLSVYLNAINVTNVRQTRFDPLLRPSPGPGGNPLTDVWAPLDGRTINLGIKIP